MSTITPTPVPARTSAVSGTISTEEIKARIEATFAHDDESARPGEST
ncbi:hypothetical protein [Rhodococcus tibetensis]|uniref:Uncharacterized protein n=1 Tax=Rhodococcus tibetensis TaxID=2965064 RepID=A0ABT1QD79_9NOCA|nr:hypothetical protein [Rhodococcus sp. FXJ9.536]MCQ4119700.1 hypothetical protein [Rhodococcus sp. FXJ9.536]